jgi:hypothetical protein
MGNRVRIIPSQHTRLPNGWRFCPISIPMNTIFVPYPYPNRGIPHGLVGIGSPLTSLGAMEKIREEMTELFRDRLGVSVARVGQSYQKPYDHWFDTVPYTQGARIPEFFKFYGENGRSTHEHIGQFLAHLGELADGEAFRVRLFSLSLTGTAFAWYTALPLSPLIPRMI